MKTNDPWSALNLLTGVALGLGQGLLAGSAIWFLSWYFRPELMLAVATINALLSK